ncbi:hypothetical protein Scep_004563 [Stephania cephalantha]|uniref:Uncharacterized protein n=1 Tax=Stephania cephalantha TaxID=152367 RepID=A0AAP0PXE7_9MAGN
MAVTALLVGDWRARLGDLVLFEEIWKWGFGIGGFWWWRSEFELLSAGARAFCRHRRISLLRQKEVEDEIINENDDELAKRLNKQRRQAVAAARGRRRALSARNSALTDTSEMPPTVNELY